MSIANLERIQSDSRPEQAGPEMKQVGFAVAVREFDRREFGVLEPVQTIRFSDLGIEALGTKLPITRLYGTVVDDIVVRHGTAATLAAGLLRSSDLHLIHLPLSIPAWPYRLPNRSKVAFSNAGEYRKLVFLS